MKECFAFYQNMAYLEDMKRDIYQSLEKWKQSTRRKPLIINGARQVGKTYALKHFGKTSYKNIVYLNFEKDEKLGHFFDATLDPKQLIKTFRIHTEQEIHPHSTLLIFDEVQECPKALNSLKYFCEEANEYHVATAGSLLGVKIAKEKGFPVGKVNFLHMYPLTFFEFLSAVGQEKTRLFLEEYHSYEPLADPLHEKLVQLLKMYFFTGGMPEAVAEYAKLGGPAIQAAGGRFIARGTPAKTYEAGLNQRTVVIEFDSVDKATTAYQNPAYQAALRLIDGKVDRDVRIVEGVA